MFLFHPFLNIWYFLSDILSDILSDTLSDSCSAASDYLRQTWYHCSFGFTRKSLKCLANIAGLLKIHTCQIREFWSNLTKTTTRRWLSDNIGALKYDGQIKDQQSIGPSTKYWTSKLEEFAFKYQKVRNGWSRTSWINKQIFSLLHKESAMR